MNSKKQILTRRRLFLQSLRGAGALGSLGTLSLGGLANPRAGLAQAAPDSNPDRKFLFVIAASGGASLLDSFAPVTASTASAGSFAYSDDQVARPVGSNLSCVKPIVDDKLQGVLPLGVDYSMEQFLRNHGSDLAVLHHQVTSVNHLIAAERAMHGNYMWKGQTLPELFADRFGKGQHLANCNMGVGGYASPGKDKDLSLRARAEIIRDPLLFGLATHAQIGLQSSITKGQLDLARELRAGLEKLSPFVQSRSGSQRMQQYAEKRAAVLEYSEKQNLVEKLVLVAEQDGKSLSDFGIQPHGSLDRIASVFPNLGLDPFEAQAGLAYQLVAEGISTAVTISPGDSPLISPDKEVWNTPIGFDYSHDNHRGTQNAMWGRVMKVTDGLIGLLKQTPYQDPAGAMGSLWDRSIIYIATEFGRDKVSRGGSGHHVHGGSLVISPMIKGNQTFGSVDPATGLVSGFDPKTGNPDPSAKILEGHIYSAVAMAGGIDFEGRLDMSGIIK